MIRQENKNNTAGILILERRGSLFISTVSKRADI